jgi:cell wall-associated NlpC family hydrolase
MEDHPMGVNIEDALLLSISQEGDVYVFGAEAAKTNADPTQFDCSELVEWSCNRAGITMPDGAFNQWRHTESLAVPVSDAMRTRGALLFVGDGTGTGREAITHVAWSLGDGTTVEARGKKWGVGCWPSAGRFDFAATIPGADYGPPTVPPAEQPNGRPVIKEGSTGVHVSYLQAVLSNRGFKGLDDKLIAVDGSFGKNTKSAVLSVQRWCKVTDDGVVGPTTWAIIDQLARA